MATDKTQKPKPRPVKPVPLQSGLGPKRPPK